MPIEILGRGELDRLIRETFRKLIDESSLLERFSNLETTVNELKLASLKQFAVTAARSPHQALARDLGHRVRMLDINFEGDPITLRPKWWLRTEDFRAIVEVFRRHGGTWSPEKRASILDKTAVRQHP